MKFTLPNRVCCPICKRPDEEWDRASNKMVVVCSFFHRCQNLKYDGDPKRSAELRSQAFHDFHADVCETCCLPLEKCRERRLAAVKRKMAKENKEGSRDEKYAEPWELTKLTDEMPCKPPERKYTPIPPGWYVPATKGSKQHAAAETANV